MSVYKWCAGGRLVTGWWCTGDSPPAVHRKGTSSRWISEMGYDVNDDDEEDEQEEEDFDEEDGNREQEEEEEEEEDSPIKKFDSIGSRQREFQVRGRFGIQKRRRSKGSTLFVDRSGTSVIAYQLPYLLDLEKVKDYAWRAACLAYMYHQIGVASKFDNAQIGGEVGAYRANFATEVVDGYLQYYISRSHVRITKDEQVEPSDIPPPQMPDAGVCNILVHAFIRFILKFDNKQMMCRFSNVLMMLLNIWKIGCRDYKKNVKEDVWVDFLEWEGILVVVDFN
ncbi:Protein MAINTENANCE OF MERISTEMS [Bienertia sinuspersici]